MLHCLKENQLKALDFPGQSQSDLKELKGSESSSEWAVVLFSIKTIPVSCCVVTGWSMWGGWRGQGQAVVRGWRSRVGRGEREGVREHERKRLRVCEPGRGGGWWGSWRRLVVRRQVGDEWGGQRSGQADGRVWRCVVGGRWHEPHEVKAAGVEVGGAPGTHHQDLFGVVVQSGDTRRHADSEGKPGHADWRREEQQTCLLVCVDNLFTCRNRLNGTLDFQSRFHLEKIILNLFHDF